MPPLNESPLSAADAIRYETIHKALADRYRYRILALLKGQKGGMCVEDITSYFDIDQSTISHHLKKLRLAGLVDSRKRARHNLYFIVPDKLAEVHAALGDLLHQRVKSGKKSA